MLYIKQRFGWITFILIMLVLISFFVWYKSQGTEDYWATLETIDGYCFNGTQTKIVLKYTAGLSGYKPIDVNDITVTRIAGKGATSFSWSNPTINLNDTVILTDEGCTTRGNPTTCIYKIVAPWGKSINEDGIKIRCLG